MAIAAIASQITKIAVTKERHLREIFIITSHNCYISDPDVCDIFKGMFPNNSIAQQMKCGSTKYCWITRKIQHITSWFNKSGNKGKIAVTGLCSQVL